ncbi:hypothetical protein Btru_050461 [Bulinus truncatus]|nr:hypothetical protein Btru_050461 [Bulinus truncatus]
MVFNICNLTILILSLCEVMNGDQLENQCITVPGFRLEKNLLASSCLWWSDMSMRFLDAKRYCESKGAFLASFKTLEKFQILQRQRQRYWIGLDDLGVDGTYQWHDGGKILSRQYMSLIFRKGEPNNRNRNEHCIEYSPISKLLNDNNCQLVLKFVCERKLEM